MIVPELAFVPALPWLLLVGSAAVLVTALVATWVMRRRIAHVRAEEMVFAAERAEAERRLQNERILAHEREIGRGEAAVRELRENVVRLENELRRLATHEAALEAENAQLESQLDGTAAELRALRPVLAHAENRGTELATRLEDIVRSHAEKEATFTAASEALRNEFRLLGHKIFEEHGHTFAEDSGRRLDGLLGPFREQIAEFKRRVEEVYHTDTRDRASLVTEVRNLQRASERINTEAGNLARALKGDKKLQGNWGELVLERVLDESGLRKGHEYDTQPGLHTDDGELKRPDVVVHLPDGKDVVVDSKVSLAAYEQALAAEDDTQREQLVRQHVNDLRAQVRRLAEQDYDRLKGVRSLDFVLLFVPVEPAFTLAMEREPGLFTEAFTRRIVIVSPTTLLMTLRIIHNVWRVDKQNRHAEEIARRAGALYDKLRIAMDDMTRLGVALRTADATYRDAMRKLATGRGNLVRQVERFRELGAGVKRPFAAEVLEGAELEEDEYPAVELDDSSEPLDESVG